MPRSSGQKILPTRIMVFGTFDIIHPGHRHFFKQARALAKNPVLIVSVARDANVVRIKNRRPDNNQAKRIEAINQLPEVDEVVLGGLKSHMPHIKKAQPDIIALGYDQTAYVENLQTELAQAGLQTKVVRMKAYKPQIHKTSIIRNNK